VTRSCAILESRLDSVNRRHILGPVPTCRPRWPYILIPKFGGRGYYSVSTIAAKSQIQTSRVPNVWPCHLLSKRRANLNRSRLNLGLPWMLTMGGPLLWRTDSPQMPGKEPRWMADRHMIVCMPRVTQSIGVGGSKWNQGFAKDFGRFQTGLVGVARPRTGPSGGALPLKTQNQSNRVSWTRGPLHD